MESTHNCDSPSGFPYTAHLRENIYFTKTDDGNHIKQPLQYYNTSIF